MVRNIFGRGKNKKKEAPVDRASDLIGHQQSLNEISVYTSSVRGSAQQQQLQQQQQLRQQQQQQQQPQHGGGHPPPPQQQQQQQQQQYPPRPPHQQQPPAKTGRPGPPAAQYQQQVSPKEQQQQQGNRVVTTTVQRVPPPPQHQQQQHQQQPLKQQPPPQSSPHRAGAPQQQQQQQLHQQRPPPSPPLTASSSAANNSNGAASTPNEPIQDKTTALTRDLVKKFIADIWNRGEIDLIPSVCSPSLRFNGNTGFDRVGHDGLARMVGTIREALDDYHCEIHSMVVEHNKAFCRLRFTGKHTGPLLGFSPTHKVVAWMGATEFTCQNGKILKVWELGDVKSLEEQISGIGGGGDGPAKGSRRPGPDDPSVYES